MKCVIEVVWSCIKGINRDVTPKTMALKTFNDLHHEPQTDIYQETDIGKNPYTLHYSLVHIIYDNLLGECLGYE